MVRRLRSPKRATADAVRFRPAKRDYGGRSPQTNMENKEPDNQSEQERLIALAEKLDMIQAEKNQGRGVSHLRYVVEDLKRGEDRKSVV